MRRSKGSRPKFDAAGFRRRLPAIGFALLVSLFLAWQIVRTTVVNAAGRDAPAAAAKVAPNDPEVIRGFIEMELANRQGIVGPAAKAAGRQALQKAPLMDEPFLLAGIDGLIAKDNRLARLHLTRALARNPRNRLSRLFMLELELRAHDPAGAAQDMTILSRLMPDVQKVFVPELARLARDPQTNRGLRDTLRSDPVMLASVLDNLAANRADPDLVLWLAGDSAGAVNGDVADWRRTLLNAMVGRDDVDRARQLWAGFSGVDAAKVSGGVYDADFAGLPGLPPFNWDLSSSEMGAAERDRKGGLQVEYYGRTRGELAAQMLTLSPGAYRLLVRAEGDLDTPQHRLVWRVLCSKSNAVVAELPLAKITYAGRTLAGNFTIPKGCDAQWLKLFGEPTEFPKIENVLIRTVRIQKIGTVS